MAVLALWALARPATAQSTPERETLRRWDDSLATLRAATPATDLSASEMQRALVLIRDGELRGRRSEVEEAIGILVRVRAAHRDWPWPSFLLARGLLVLNRDRALLRLGDALKVGESYTEGAWRYLRNALQVDSTFGEARELAANLLVAEGERELRGDEQAVLAQLVRDSSPHPEALLTLARDQRIRGRYDSSLISLRRSAAVGGDPSRLALERARTLIASRRADDAAASYWEGIEKLSPVGRAAYRYDLAWILGADSLAAFDRLPDDSISSWLHRFWDERDAAAAHYRGERLEEQLRRWNEVISEYRVSIPWRRTEFARVEYLFEGLDQCVSSNAALYDLLGKEQPSLAGDPRYREPLLDHRGLIYLRHGQPMRIITGSGFGEPSPLELSRAPVSAMNRLNAELAQEMDLSMWQNEAWLYWFEGAWRILNFRGSKALGTNAPTTLTSYLPVQNAAQTLYFSDWQARALLSPEYAAAMTRIAIPTVTPKSCLREVKLVIDKSRDDAATATHSDSDTPLIGDPWNAVLQLFALGGEQDHDGKALVSFAIPGDMLEISRPDRVHSIYAVNFRFVAYDRVSGRTISTDSTRRYLVADVLDHQQRISGWFELPLPAGNWQVAVKAGQDNHPAGAFALARDLVIGGDATLGMSDIVIGRKDSPQWQATDGVEFPLNVHGAYSEREAAELFYELRGIERDSTYRTTIEVRPAHVGDPGGIRIANTDRSGGGVLRLRKTLGLERLKPGSYVLTVSITSNGKTVSRSRPLLIAERKGPTR